MSQSAFQGRAWKFGDDIDTDQIIPAQYAIHSLDPVELGRHALEGNRLGWASHVSPGDLLVAGSNFGCGSSREIAPVAIRAAGIAAVVAFSFARIFYRNAINIGFAIFVAPRAADAVVEGDQLRIDPDSGVIENLTRHERYEIDPLPAFMRELLASGGLAPWVRRRLADRTRTGLEL